MKRIAKYNRVVMTLFIAAICMMWYIGCDEEKPLSPISKTTPEQLSPLNGEHDVSRTPALKWVPFSGALSYRVQLALDTTFQHILVEMLNVTGTSYTTPPLPANTICYWKVRGETTNGPTDWSLTRAFRTAVLSMVLVPSGTFQMGNLTNSIYGDTSEKPIHSVTLTRSFYIGKYEVTQAEWQSVMGNNPSYFTGDSLPVEQIQWYDVIKFCNSLSIADARDTCYTGTGTNIVCNFNANGYRLPTEAEWEYACRGGTTTDFYSGNLTNPECTPADQNLDQVAWYCNNSGNTTHPVGIKNPNSLGIYDMHGNVIELCWDWWSQNYYSVSPGTDPTGPTSSTYRIMRGGSMMHKSQTCRSSYRSRATPDRSSSYMGFRVVRNAQ